MSNSDCFIWLYFSKYKVTYSKYKVTYSKYKVTYSKYKDIDCYNRKS